MSVLKRDPPLFSGVKSSRMRATRFGIAIYTGIHRRWTRYVHAVFAAFCTLEPSMNLDRAREYFMWQWLPRRGCRSACTRVPCTLSICQSLYPNNVNDI